MLHKHFYKESSLWYTNSYGGNIIMSQEVLKTRLLSDLSQLNLPIDEVDLYIRPFSKTFYGRYFPVHNDKEIRPKIYIYPYINKKEDLMEYDKILETAIHELCHHIQYTSGSFVRSRGIMHDIQFWKLYNHYIERAKKYQMIGGEKQYEKKII